MIQPNGAPLPQPVPTIEVVLQQVGTGCGFTPTLTFHHMPGGWKTVHEALCIVLHQVAGKMAEDAAQRGGQRIQLVQALPEVMQ